MRTLLLSMLLACGETEDSGQAANNGQTGVESEDPKWFEAGTYYGGYPKNLTFTLSQTGSISSYELSWEGWDYYNDRATSVGISGECFIGEAITPDENMWEATCEGLSEVIVYSEGFRIDFSWRGWDGDNWEDYSVSL